MEKTLKEATVTYLIKDRSILLPKKTRKIGAGRRNGYGGGVEEGEEIVASALRELFEESEVRGKRESVKKVAELRFKNTTSDGLDWDILVHMFFVHEWEGEVKETEEMIDPKWFSFDAMPWDEMMEADQKWLPLALSGKKVIVRTHYGPLQKGLLAPIKIEEVLEF